MMIRYFCRILFAIILIIGSLSSIVVESKAEDSDVFIISNSYISITTAEELDAVRNNRTGNYVLNADIDLTGINWTPIGNSSSTAFTGVFDGNGHIISNLNVSVIGDYAGLFGYTNGATLTGIHIKNVDVTGNNNVGVIVGMASNGSEITDCSVTGTGTIEGVKYVGGIVGRVYSTGKISSCFSTIAVDASGDEIGGIVGQMALGQLDLNRCFSTGSVTGNKNVGGEIGSVYSLTGEIPSMSDCYATGSVAGNTYVGGIIGNGTEYFQNGGIENCYFAGAVSGLSNVGGLMGKSSFHVSKFINSYFDSNITELPTPTGQARTTEQMKQKDTYNGWDFNDTWIIVDGATYPVLRNMGINIRNYGASGDGITNDKEAFQRAFENSQKSGAPIYVPDGRYNLNYYSLTSTEKLFIIGESKENTLLVEPGQFNIIGDLTIVNFSVYKTGIGYLKEIFIRVIEPTDTSVRPNITADNIKIYNNNDPTTQECTLRFISGIGTSTNYGLGHVSVTNCELSRCRYGVKLSMPMQSAYLAGNRFEDFGTEFLREGASPLERAGIVLGDNSPGGTEDDDDTTEDGLLWANNVVVRNNTIDTIYANYYGEVRNGSYPLTFGILIYGNNVLIEDNYLTDILGGHGHYGIYFKGSHAVIQNNTLYNAGESIGSITAKRTAYLSILNNTIITDKRSRYDFFMTDMHGGIFLSLNSESELNESELSELKELRYPDPDDHDLVHLVENNDINVIIGDGIQMSQIMDVNRALMSKLLKWPPMLQAYAILPEFSKYPSKKWQIL